MSKYFNLAPECYLVIGIHRSAIYNLDTGNIIALDEIQTKALALAESKKPIEEDADVYGYLVDKGWGFYSSKPVFVDKARPMNTFGERRIWLQQMQFLMAVLQLTQQCNKGCADCGSTFCPICIADNTKQDTLPVEQWMCIIDKLAEANCKTVMFTGGECLLYDDLPKLIKYAQKAGIGVSIKTSGELPLDNIPEDVAVSVLVNKSSNIANVLKNLRGRKRVSLILQNVDRNVLGTEVDKTWEVRITSASEPIKGKRHLGSEKLDDFFYRKLKDPCLNGKMFVLSDGSVVPCFQGRNEVLGNLAVDDFSEIFQKLTIDYWYAVIDDRLKGKRCGQCELKYACSSCRFSNPEASCLYDPANDLWKI